MSRMTPSSEYPIRNIQHPPSMTLRTGSSWHSFIHARELKFGTQVKNKYYNDPWFQEWPHPPSIQSGTFNVLQVWLRGQGVLDTLLFMLESWNLAHKSRITYNDNPWCQGWPYPPRHQSGTFSILQVCLWGWGVLDTLLIMLECWNLAHKSRIKYNDDPWCKGWPYPPRPLAWLEVCREPTVL